MKKILVSTLFLIAGLLLLSTPCVLAQPCEGNFDCDQDVDGTDASVFKEDFGRSQFFNPCPDCIPCPEGLIECGGMCVDKLTNENHCGGCDIVCGSGEVCIEEICEIFNSFYTYAPVEKTGQTTTFATGDDGDLERGIAWPDPRFTDNSDGTVTDNLTGLIWLKNADCFGAKNWTNALSDSNGLDSGQCGLTDGSSAGDWRLPNLKEFLSLADYEQSNPALPNGHPFTNVSGNYVYWTSTTDIANTLYAWALDLQSMAKAWNISKTSNNRWLWPVRGGID